MHNNFIGTRISDLRNKRGVSARDMSLSLGRGVNYINTIENHNSLPSMNEFLYICEYFGISPQEFFDNGNNNPEMIATIVKELKKLKNKQLVSVCELLKSINEPN